jgi:hypothetical protein
VQILVQCLILLCLSSLSVAAESIAEIQPDQSTLYGPGRRSGMNLITIAALPNITVGEFKVTEISDLAWDADEGILYAISDNGYLLHLRPVIENNLLKDVLLLAGYSLRDGNNVALHGKSADSEGLTTEKSNNKVKGDTELLISFERKPRVVRYTPEGKLLNTINLPAGLGDISRYQSENKSFEALVLHGQFGILIGSEYPLKGSKSGVLSIFSVNGDEWNIPAHNREDGALVGMTVMADGNLLALERAYGGIFPGIETTLHRIILAKTQYQSHTIITLRPGDIIFNENFEGITHYDGDHYFMISDDNNHPLKRTLLVYFSIFME